MSNAAQWLIDIDKTEQKASVDGLVYVKGFDRKRRTPEEIVMMEKAESYEADAVFFEFPKNNRPPVAQVFIYFSDQLSDTDFAEIYRRLWSWGEVPLVYRKKRGLIELLRCAHKPDFKFDTDGELKYKAFNTLKILTSIDSDVDPWWDADQLRRGTIWDDPTICKDLISADSSAHKRLFNAFRDLYKQLEDNVDFPKDLQCKLLILTLLIAYLEERKVLDKSFFSQYLDGAEHFFNVLSNGEALVKMLKSLESRFNGNVFTLSDNYRNLLRQNTNLSSFSDFVRGFKDINGQLTLWRIYSFKDLPIELISNIYQLFVEDADSSVYTPPFLVKLMLDEVLSKERIDRLYEQDEIILDPSCGSGVFLVEAYKRLILHWRVQNNWKQPNDDILRSLIMKVHGIDKEDKAVEVATFSLYLSLCDALKPEDIRKSIKLFPPLSGVTIHHSCFFEAIEKKLISSKVGVIVGNPPFTSTLNTDYAKDSYKRYYKEHGQNIPDKQLAYLFLHESMSMLNTGGALCMLQQYNFLYNQESLDFRRGFLNDWNAKEILDFISIRGLFSKGNADTKVLVIIAEALKPRQNETVLHAIFRRSGRVDAEVGFDIDYYDMHWISRELILTNDKIWRSNLLGGYRVLAFTNRLRQYRSLKQYADKLGWDYGEGFIVGKSGKREKAPHITGEKLIETRHLYDNADLCNLKTVTDTDFKSAYTSARFKAPMLLIHEHEDLNSRYINDGYFVYKNKIVGFTTIANAAFLEDVNQWLKKERLALQVYSACISLRLYTQKATTLSADDILSLPYPEIGSLEMSSNEKIVVDDILDYYRDLIRLGEKSKAMMESSQKVLPDFCDVFTRQINGIYHENPLKPLEHYSWPGVICQPFVFGDGNIDWQGVDGLKDKLSKLLNEKNGTNLNVTRIVRIYDGSFVFMIKPDRLRYWLRSIALRDADEMISDLREQGF